MSTTKEQTMIIVPKALRNRLKKLKVNPRIPYYIVIEALIDKSEGKSYDKP